MDNITALGYPESDATLQARYAYDTVWAAALALHNASIELENGRVGGRHRLLSEFTYADSEINGVILNAARGLNFRGVSVSMCLLLRDAHGYMCPTACSEVIVNTVVHILGDWFISQHGSNCNMS